MVKLASTLTKLPFTHGIESEIQIVNLKGRWIDGEKMVSIMGKIVQDVAEGLKGILRDPQDELTEMISKKTSNIRIAPVERRGDTLIVTYTLSNGEQVDIEILGRDPHIGTITWILEAATPPCTTLEELAWWMHTILKLSHDSLPAGVKFITTGLNPLMEYQQGLSFGDHHHIGVPDPGYRLSVYNLIRAFIPHLVALSVNSPFVAGRPTDIVTMKDGRLQAPGCIRSIRLQLNARQLGPDDPQHYIPHLTSLDESFFERVVGRTPARMCDMYPFTRFNTVEIRVFDSQISVIRKVALAALLQALALKAKKLHDGGELIPEVDSETLIKNRRSAIRWGLTGPFFKPRNLDEFARKHPNFAAFYFFDCRLGGKEPVKRIVDAVKNMFFFLKEELEELGILKSEFLSPLLVSVYGDMSGKIIPPMTTADYQLEKYFELGESIESLSRELQIIADQTCSNVWSDPLSGTPNLQELVAVPVSLELSFEPSIVFEGQSVTCKIFVENKGEEPLRDLNLSCVVIDHAGEEVLEELFTLETLEPGERRYGEIEFDTEAGVPQYTLSAKLTVSSELVAVEKLAIPVYRVVCKTDLIAQVDGVIVTGETEIPFIVAVENTTPQDMYLTLKISVVDKDQGRELDSVLSDLKPWGVYLKPIRAKDHALFVAMSEEIAKLDWAKAVLEGQTEGSWVEIDPLVLKPWLYSSWISPRCAIRAQLLDSSGHVISESWSRDFRVFFQGAMVSVEVGQKPKSTYNVGETLETSLMVDASDLLSPSPVKVVVKIKSPSDETFERKIFEASVKPGVSTTMPVKWTIPRDILGKGAGEGVFYLTVEVLHDGELVNLVEAPAKFKVVRGPEVSLKWSEVPKSSLSGSTIRGKLSISGLSSSLTPCSLVIESTTASGSETVATMELSDPVTESSIDVPPIPVPSGVKSILLTAAIIKDSKKIAEDSIQVNVLDLREAISVIVHELPPSLPPGSLHDIIIQIENLTDSTLSFELAYREAVDDFTVLDGVIPIEIAPKDKVLARIPIKVPLFAVDKECAVKLEIKRNGASGWTTERRLLVEAVKPLIRVAYISTPPLSEYIQMEGDKLELKLSPSVQSFADYNLPVRAVFAVFEKKAKKVILRKTVETTLIKGNIVRLTYEPIIWEVHKPKQPESYYLGMIFFEKVKGQLKEIPNKLVQNSLITVTFTPS
ncbi:MAG: glutamate-cysteine ligase family protein [Candidatus Freyarchaeota archaeon]|nr:glutamate-cysteine ligase family protein [Candidatus Freyrarchaeum guaymaensis]